MESLRDEPKEPKGFCQTSFRWYVLEIYRVGSGDRVPVRGNDGHTWCPSGTDARIEISVISKVEEGLVIVDLLPKTFAERGVGHIFDNLKTTTMQENTRLSLTYSRVWTKLQREMSSSEWNENMNSDDFQNVSPN